jgi:hypothetical protein
MSNIFDRGSAMAKQFVGFITDKKTQSKSKKQIWGDGVSVLSGNIHALVLKLFVSGMIKLYLKHDNMAGKDGIESKHVMICLAKRNIGDGTILFEDFQLNNETLWSPFNCSA